MTLSFLRFGASRPRLLGALRRGVRAFGARDRGLRAWGPGSPRPPRVAVHVLERRFRVLPGTAVLVALLAVVVTTGLGLVGTLAALGQKAVRCCGGPSAKATFNELSSNRVVCHASVWAQLALDCRRSWRALVAAGLVEAMPVLVVAHASRRRPERVCPQRGYAADVELRQKLRCHLAI